MASWIYDWNNVYLWPAFLIFTLLFGAFAKLREANNSFVMSFRSPAHPHGTTRLLLKKVKCTLVQALRLFTGRTAHRGSWGIALPFLDHGTGRGWGGQRHAPAALYPRERPGIHCTGGWVGPRAGLDRCGKSRLHRDSIPGPPSP